MITDRWRQVTSVLHPASARDAKEGSEHLFPGALAPGTTLGPYRIEALIGTGGMGEVYRASDARLGRCVAIKILPEVARDDVESRRRFEREARAISSLSHPHICTLYDIGEHEGLTYLVMELLHGETLAARLERGPLSIDEALRHAADVAQALDHAHRHDIVHRDLKPRNVMLTRDGAKLLDFGLATPQSRRARSPSPVSAHADDSTGVGMIVGTLPYMAPEQIDGGDADGRTDIFAFGAVLFEMLTGRRAFQGDCQARLISAVLRDDPPPVSTLQPLAPPVLDHLVRRCLAKQPDERWQTAADLARELKWLCDERHDVERHAAGALSSDAARVPRPRLAAIAGVVAALAIGLTASWELLTTREDASVQPAAPAVVAVLPHDNPAGDPVAEQYGLVVTTFIARSFRLGPAMKVLTREATAPYAAARMDLEPLRQTVGAGYAIDLTVRRVTPSADVLARLRRPGQGRPAWEQAFTGDVLAVQRALLTGLTDALVQEGVGPIRAGGTGLAERLPASAPPLLAYVQARALLEYREAPGNVTRAVALLERAVEADERFALAHAALADALNALFGVERDSALLDRAESEARTALHLDPDESAAHVAFAAVEFARGHAAAAFSALQRAIDLQPDNDTAYGLRGQFLAETKTAEAIAPLQTAIRLRPRSFRHHYVLGYARYRQARFEAAAEAYRTATQIQPENARPYQMLGVVHQMLGETESAIGDYQHAIRLGAGATAHANLGLAYFTAGDYQKALTEYRIALEREPRKASLHRDIADVYLRLNRRAEARASYERAISLAEAALAIRRGDPSSIVLIGLCKANLGLRLEAESHAAEAVSLAPDDYDILYRAAKVYTLTGSRVRALKWLRRAIERGFAPGFARYDPELAPLRSMPGFELALSATSEGQR